MKDGDAPLALENRETLKSGAKEGRPPLLTQRTAGLAVIVFELIQKHGFAALGPIIVLAGVFQIASGFLKVGQLFRTIAPAVIYGMLAGIGIPHRHRPGIVRTMPAPTSWGR